MSGVIEHCYEAGLRIYHTNLRLQTNFSLAASFWGIHLLSAFILLRRLKLAIKDKLEILHLGLWFRVIL